MCSIDNENESFKNNLKLEDTKICLKCKINIPLFFLRSDGIYCKDCFVSHITHKFRLEFGKSHLIRDNEKVLIYIDCSKYSLTLMHLINEGINKRAQKKLRFVPLCIYIINNEVDENGSIEEIKCKLVDPVNYLGLPICIYHINQLNNKSIEPLYSNIDYAPHSYTNLNPNDFKMDFKNQTSLITCNEILRNHLLVKVAKNLGITKVILSDNANKLARNLFLNIIEGRGDQLSHQMGFVDDRYNDILFVRPLKNFTNEEIDAWIHLHSLTLPNNDKFEIKNYEKNMQNLTETFLTNLQKENENTLPIVCRIGEKFSSHEKTKTKCILCKSPYVADSLNIILECSGKEDKLNDSSSNVSGEQINNCRNVGNCCDNNARCCEKRYSSNRNKSKLLEHCCYGCKIVINDMKDVNQLPDCILKDLFEIENRKNMHEFVKNYLVEDG